jgi:hypothetical protein
MTCAETMRVEEAQQQRMRCEYQSCGCYAMLLISGTCELQPREQKRVLACIGLQKLHR